MPLVVVDGGGEMPPQLRQVHPLPEGDVGPPVEAAVVDPPALLLHPPLCGPAGGVCLAG